MAYRTSTTRSGRIILHACTVSAGRDVIFWSVGCQTASMLKTAVASNRISAPPTFACEAALTPRYWRGLSQARPLDSPLPVPVKCARSAQRTLGETNRGKHDEGISHSGLRDRRAPACYFNLGRRRNHRGPIPPTLDDEPILLRQPHATRAKPVGEAPHRQHRAARLAAASARTGARWHDRPPQGNLALAEFRKERLGQQGRQRRTRLGGDALQIGRAHV